MRLTQIIEALLFASDAPLSAADLSRVDERLDEDTVEAVIQELRAEYELSERSFQIYEVAGGFQLLTRPEFVTVLERYDSVPQPSRLSAPALEVLAIIAYRQPLGRAEIEEIRGVGSSGVLRTLQERNLIEPVGRGEGLGRPLLYGTTKKFLEHFGFRSLEDLPRPDELPVVLRERPAESPVPAGGDEGTPEGEPSAGTPAEPTAPEAGDAGAEGAPAEPVAEEAGVAAAGAPSHETDVEAAGEVGGAGEDLAEPDEELALSTDASEPEDELAASPDAPEPAEADVVDVEGEGERGDPDAEDEAAEREADEFTPQS